MRAKWIILAGLMIVLSAVVSYADDAAMSAGQPMVDDATKTEVIREIEQYIAMDVDLKGAFFILDPRSKNVLRLTFDHVHDGVMAHPKGYAACADFKDSAGKLYDVDLVVDASSDQARVRGITLHKVNGKPVQAEKPKEK